MKHSKTHTTEDTWQLGKLILHCAMFARYDHSEKKKGKKQCDQPKNICMEDTRSSLAITVPLSQTNKTCLYQRLKKEASMSIQQPVPLSTEMAPGKKSRNHYQQQKVLNCCKMLSKGPTNQWNIKHDKRNDQLTNKLIRWNLPQIKRFEIHREMTFKGLIK